MTEIGNTRSVTRQTSQRIGHFSVTSEGRRTIHTDSGPVENGCRGQTTLVRCTRFSPTSFAAGAWQPRSSFLAMDTRPISSRRLCDVVKLREHGKGTTWFRCSIPPRSRPFEWAAGSPDSLVHEDTVYGHPCEFPCTLLCPPTRGSYARRPIRNVDCVS